MEQPVDRGLWYPSVMPVFRGGLQTLERPNGGLPFGPAPSPEGNGRVTTLSPRQLTVLSGVADGFSNKEIGRHLGISERTVKNHLTCIMQKLGAHSRTHAVIIALRLGFLRV